MLPPLAKLAAGVVASALLVGTMAPPASAAGGVLDPRFGEGGVVTTPSAPGAGFDLQAGLAIQTDGKLVVGGISHMGDATGFQWRVSRYTRAGDLDPSFAAGGTALVNLSDFGEFDERLSALALQSDGKIVVAGFAQTGPAEQDSAIVRLNADGSLDATFGDGGRVITDVATGFDFVRQVLVDDQGRIVVGGGCAHFYVARYLPDGTLDQSFNADGPRPGIAITEVTPTSPENHDGIHDIAFDAQGRIVAAGHATTLESGVSRTNSALARYRADGVLDTTFNAAGPTPGVVIHGVAPADGWDVIFRVAVDRRGRIVTAGDAFVGIGAGNYDIALARYLPDGRIDATFGDDGVALTNAGPGDSDDDAQGLVLLPDGDIVVGGSAAPTAFLVDSDFMIARFRSDGSLDDRFGNGGVLVTPTGAGNADDEIWGLALADPSRIVASGECDQPDTGRDVCLVRYHVNGRAGR